MKPDDPIVRAFLARSLVARVATRSSRGWPALAPLWFVALGSRLYTGTGAATLAARNAAANPAVAVLLDAEADGPSAYVLRLHGRATVSRALPPWRAMLALARKYYLSPAGLRCEVANVAKWSLRRGYYAQAEAATIEIQIERVELLQRP